MKPSYSLARATVLLSIAGSLVGTGSLRGADLPGFIFDNFDGNTTDPALWQVEISGVGPSVAEQNSRVEILFPAWSHNGGDAAFGATYVGRQLVAGDLDIRIDFECSEWPLGNGVRLGLSVAPWFVAARVSNVYGGDLQEAYVLGHYGGLTVLQTSDRAGSLRLVRQNEMLTGYYWDRQRGWTLIGSGRGPSGYVHIAFSAWSADGYFGGKPVTIAFDNFEGRLEGTIPDPPEITLEAPRPESTHTFCQGGTPIEIAFEASGGTGLITALAASVNGDELGLRKSGIGTLEAQATGRYVAADIGDYILVANAKSPLGTAMATVEFRVDYDFLWLPPFSLGKVSKGGSNLPIRFCIRDCIGRFIEDRSVTVIVSEILETGEIQKHVGTWGKEPGSVRLDNRAKHYLMNFETQRGSHQYRVDVFFAGISGYDAELILQGTAGFSVR